MPLEAENIKYIAIQGAGGKGAAYLGALSALEEIGVLKQCKDDTKGTRRFDNLEGISGTSAGSITALMLSLGYSASETNAMVIESPLFSLALGEKSDNSFYRAYENDGINDAKIGFMSFSTWKKWKPIGDRYILSKEDIKFKKNSQKLGDRLSSKIFKFSFPSSAIIAGLINSLTSSDVLENITDEIVDDIYPSFALLAKINLSEEERTRDHLEAWGFDFDLLDEVKKHLEKHKQGTQLSIGFLVLALIYYFAFFTAFNYYTDGVVEPSPNKKDDNICSKRNQRKKDNYEKWSTIKIYIRLIWNANVKRIPLSKIPILAQLLNVIDDFTTTGERSLKDKKRALLNLGRLIAEVVPALKNKQMSDSITKMLIQKIIPNFLKPISIMLKNGGILAGGRVRYLHARLIYEKVQVKGEEGNYTFHIREGNFSEKLKDNLEEFEELKLSKKLIKDYEKINEKHKNLESNILSTDAEKEELLLELNNLKSVLNAELKNSNIRDSKTKNLDETRNKLKEMHSELQTIGYIVNATKMREHLEYIERCYSFEEHNKLFPHEFTICASNLTSGGSVYFNKYLTPDFPVVEAVSASMNIPGLWRPSAIKYMPKSNPNFGKKKGGKIDDDFYKKHYYGWFVDGGVNNNIPLFAFNGHQDTTTISKAKYWTPEEKAMNNELFPKGMIVGISNFGGYCRKEKEKEKYTGGGVAKEAKEGGAWHDEAFVKQYSFLSVAGDVFGSMFGYSYKLRGFELEPYSSHILTVDYGFMGTLDFVANTEEVFRTEIRNYIYSLKFFNINPTETNKKKLIHKWEKGEKKARKKARGSGNMLKRKKMGYRKNEYDFFKFK